MAKVLDSERMYSWWWNSHISPKNSKWLQENLTEMDSNVKVMIKLIEEDADSFARRVDMYYKKRPELMKMVEEFYRAYRALAERYGNATGVIRQAHRIISEAFPNQVPMIFSDDSPEPRTPGTITPNGEFTDEYDSVARRKGLKQSNDSSGLVERVRKGLNFDEVEEKEQIMRGNENIVVKNRTLSKPNEVCESEEIQILKESLAKLEAEKEASLAQYQQSLDKLSHLESEISQTKEDFRVFNDRSTKAENEVLVLKESLTKLETEKETKLQDYQKSLERLSNLQNILSSTEEDTKKLDERASIAENEARSLKGEMDKLVVEKDEALNQYMKSLETISDLENKLRVTEEDSRMFKERAENAENEAEILKQAVSKLTQEKNNLAMQYQKCLEMISILENKLRISEEEAKRLNAEVDNGVSKLKGAEEQCLLLERTNRSLHTELESLMLKMGTQTEELTEKQKEMGRLWTCVQEERLRFVEAETAFQTLQHLHAQNQEELRSMASELNKRAQLLKVMEKSNEILQDEVLKVKVENEISASSIKNMQNEIFGLKESKGTLEEEVELRIDQRNALQQEIYCLKEELNNLNKKHVSVLDQVHAVGMDPESLGSSVKELQNENSKLKESCKKEFSEKTALLEKMVILEQLIEKNYILENSLCDLNAELEAVRGKIEILEQSCQSLMEEKSTLLDEKANLVIQLEETNKNLEKISVNNSVLENSLADAQNQLEALNARSKILEDSCQLLVNEKAGLISEKDSLISDLENTQVRLDGLEKLYGELEGRCSILEKEKESSLRKVEELQMSLDQERASYIQVSEKREIEMNHLQEECEWRKRELDQVMDNSIENEIEIFVLRRTAQQVAENNWFNLTKNEKLLVESSLLEKTILELENNNFEQKREIKSLSEEASNVRGWTFQLLKVLNIIEDHGSKGKIEQDNVYFHQLLSKVRSMKESIRSAQEENQQRDVELSIFMTLIRELKNEVLTVLEMNKALESKLRDENHNSDHLNRKLIDLKGICQVLEREKLEITEEKCALMDSFLLSEKKNNVLEEENFVLSDEVFALDNLSLIFRSYAGEKFSELRELGDDFNKLYDINADLTGKLTLTEEKLEESISIAEEENQKRDVEFSVVIELIRQLQTEVITVLEMNKALESKLRDENCNNEALLAQVEHLNMKLIDMEGTCHLLEREKLEITEEKRALMDRFVLSEKKNKVLEEENLVLSDEVLALDNLSLIFRSCTDDKFMELRELGDGFNNLHNINADLTETLSVIKGELEESISIAEEENQLRDIEFSIVITLITELQSEVLSVLEINKTLESKLRNENRNNEALLTQVENLSKKLIDMESTCQVMEREKLEIAEEKRALMKKNNFLEKENYVLFDEVLALDSLSLIFRNYNDEKFSELRELGDNFDELQDMNADLMGKLSLTEEKLEESKTKNMNLQERLKKSEDELKDISAIKDHFCDEIENAKKMLHQMELQMHEEQNKRKFQEQNLEFELQKKMNEMIELETEATLVFDWFHSSMVSELIYEQKFHELNDLCLGYMDENEDLKTQLASYGPEIVALKDCMSSLENETGIQIKFQNPESEEMQDAQATKNLNGNILPENNKAPMPSTFSDFCNLRARLQAIEKASAETKESMVRENVNLHSKLDASTRQLELLQSESGRYRRNLGHASEITEEDNESLKDIVLDQVSDGYSKREPVNPDNQIVEFSKKIIISPKKSDFQRVKSMKKQKGEFRTSDSLSEIKLSLDKLEISERFTEPLQEGNKRKVLERLNSDVQKLANLQITVQDLKRKLVVTEKDKRGKDVIECEALKNQLEETDVAIMKLFDLNGKLMKNIEYFPEVKSSFDLEKDGNARKRRVSEQARRMSEKIGRLQLEVQKLQFVLQKLYDDKEGKAKITAIKKRVLLRDYLYGGVRKDQRRKKTPFWACVQPSTVED